MTIAVCVECIIANELAIKKNIVRNCVLLFARCNVLVGILGTSLSRFNIFLLL